MRHLSASIAGAALLALAGGAAAQVDIVTTTTDSAAIARAVGGGHVVAESLTPGTRDPHYAEARPSMIRRVYDADLLILIGAELEVGWLPAVLQSARNPDVQPGNLGFLDLSRYVRLLDVPTGPVDRSMGDVHAFGNPHYWLDPRNGVRMARAIADRLAEIDPGNAADYRARLTDFEERMGAKMQEWWGATEPLRGEPAISYHTSFRYLEDAFGFEIVDQIEPKPGIAPSAGHLAKLIDTVEGRDIDLLIMEPYYEQRSARYLNEATGITVAVIPQSVGALPDIETYFDLFDGVIAKLREAGAI